MQPVAWARNTLLRWLVHAARMRDAGLPPHAGVVALDGDVMVFERLALRWAALTRSQRARAGVFVFKAGYALLTVDLRRALPRLRRFTASPPTTSWPPSGALGSTARFAAR